MKERTVGRFSWPEDITTNCSKNTALSISQGELHFAGLAESVFLDPVSDILKSS